MREFDEGTDFEKLPSKVRYYLLEWKDANMELYLELYGDLRLKDMTTDQLKDLFILTTDCTLFQDIPKLPFVMQLCAALCCACGKVAYRCCYALMRIINYKNSIE